MKVLMFAHAGSLNRGCEAIVRSSTKILKSKLGNCSITLASLKPDTDSVIKNVDRVLNSNPKEIGMNILARTLSFAELKLFKTEHYILGSMYRDTIKETYKQDICLSIGGDNYCYGEQPWLYEIDRRIKKNGNRLVLWGCSIGEEDITNKKLQDLRNFDLILARESLTYNLLTSLGLCMVRQCADPAFIMEKEELPLPIGWKINDTIGLNFSPLIMKRNKQSIYAVKELLRHILSSTEASIALLPHVTEEGNNDFEVLEGLYKELEKTKRVILLPDNLSAAQYKGYIARMRCFITARTHASIAAYSTGVPTLVLGYSIKSRGISKDLFGTEKLVLGIDDISDKYRLISVFDEMIGDESGIRQNLLEVIPLIEENAYKAAEYLKEIIE